MSKKSTKALASATVMSLVLTTVLSAAPVKAAAGQVTRTSGSDRYQTASQVAKANWKDGAKEVVLVSGEGYADAVSASVLAKTINAPILLSASKTLSTDAKEALETLKPEKVYVIGGNASISKEVRDGLKAKYTLVELAGQNRYETNVAVANELVKNHGIKADNVMLVGGEGFSDALSVAPIAATKGQILLLGNNNEDSMKSVVDFVKANNSKVKVIGTKNVINEEMMKLLGTTDRVDGGSDRFDTNLKVLAAFKSDLKADKLYVANASGNGYADALVASALAGKSAAPLVLVDTEGSTSTSKAVEYIKTNATKSTDLNVVGGAGVVSDATIAAINKAVDPDHDPVHGDSKIEAMNLNQFKVTFGQKVDEDSAEVIENYKVDGTSLKADEGRADLQDDGRTVIVTMKGSKSQGKEVTVSVKKNVLSEDKTKTLDAFDKKVTFRDTENPTIKNVTVVGNSKVVVEFSEAINMKNLDYIAQNVKINGQKVSNLSLDSQYSQIKNLVSDNYNTKDEEFKEGTNLSLSNKVEFTLNSKLSAGKNTLKIEKDKLQDTAGFSVLEVEKDFTVEKVDGDAKVKEVTCDEQGKISVKFDRPMNKKTAWNINNYRVNDDNLTQVGSKAVEFDFDDGDKTVTIEHVKGLKDNANIIEVKDVVKDAFGNNVEDDVRISFNKKKDEIKPKVTNVTMVDSETIRVKFSEDIKNAYARNLDHYDLKDENNLDLMDSYKKDITVKPASGDINDDTDTYDIKLSGDAKLTGQKYTITIKDMIDTASTANTMEEYTETIKGEDDQSPNVTDVIKKIDETHQVVIFFSEEMNEDDLEKTSNYKYVDGEGKTKDIPSNTKLDVASDNKSVTLDFEESGKIISTNDADAKEKGDSAVRKISVSNVEDLAGNTLEGTTVTTPIAEADKATSGPKIQTNSFKLLYEDENVDGDVIGEFQLDTVLDTKLASDFKVNGVTPDRVDTDGKTVKLAFEKNSKVKIDGKEVNKIDAVKKVAEKAKLEIAKDAKSTDTAGRKIQSAEQQVYSYKLAPKTMGEWEAKDGEESVIAFNVAANQATIKFDSKLDADAAGTYKDDFKFTNHENGAEFKVAKAEVTNGTDVTFTFESTNKISEGIAVDVRVEKENIDVRTEKDQDDKASKYVPSDKDLETSTITVKSSVVDTKAGLKSKIEEAKALKPADYTKATVSTMQTKLTAAEKVVEKADATAEEIKTATDELTTAVNALVELPKATVTKVETPQGMTGKTGVLVSLPEGVDATKYDVKVDGVSLKYDDATKKFGDVIDGTLTIPEVQAKVSVVEK